MNTYTTIDEYITQFPAATQKVLQKMRKTIHDTVPGLSEKIGYGIPTFMLRGKNLVHIGAYDQFVSFYPGAEPIETFAAELTKYQTSKGTIRFPLNQPIPYDLIEKITKHREAAIK